MAETSGPWDIPAPGAEIVGDQSRAGFGLGPWRRMMRAFGDGVIRDSNTDALKVFASSTERRVGVTPGEALIQGAHYIGTPSSTGSSTTASFPIPNGAGGWQVVLRYDPAANTVRVALRGGGALTRQQDGVWEMLLATVNAPTSGLIAQSAVRDERTDTTSNYWRAVLEGRFPRVARHQPDSARLVQPSDFVPVALHVSRGADVTQRGGEPTRLYFPRDGWYLTGGHMAWQPPSGVPAAGVREAALFVDGAGFTPATTAMVRNTGFASTNLHGGVEFFRANQYLELHQKHGQDRAVAIDTTTNLWAIYQGAA